LLNELMKFGQNSSLLCSVTLPCSTKFFLIASSSQGNKGNKEKNLSKKKKVEVLILPIVILLIHCKLDGKDLIIFYIYVFLQFL